MCFFLKDIPENGADVAHLKTVHETGVQAGRSVDYKLSNIFGRIITHHWEVYTSNSWLAGPDYKSSYFFSSCI